MDKRFSALIVDDEMLARQMIREYLQKYSHIDTIAEAANGFEAVKMIAELRPDLIFLDIQMPKLNGFEVLELAERRTGVIFVTAYDQFALKAFEIHALDYLLKPFSEQRFDEALKHALEHLGDELPADIVQKPANEFLERILIREGTKVHVIPVDTIDFIEAQDDYVQIVADGKSYLKQQALSELESQLPLAQFVRIHRSYIVNIERIGGIELYAKDSRIATLKNGKQIPISRSGYQKIKKIM
ncbi:LytTR family transcriptional regulator DNA-binding domain-containing protein [bacterium]|nr:LytTR family transcriptional regulator DNA-binding domain-containing protein [bacterium]